MAIIKKKAEKAEEKVEAPVEEKPAAPVSKNRAKLLGQHEKKQ